MAKCKPKSCAPRHAVAWSVLSTKLCLLPMSPEEPLDRHRGGQIRAWEWVQASWPVGLLLSSESAVPRSLRQVAATRLAGTQAGIHPLSQAPSSQHQWIHVTTPGVYRLCGLAVGAAGRWLCSSCSSAKREAGDETHSLPKSTPNPARFHFKSAGWSCRIFLQWMSGQKQKYSLK